MEEGETLANLANDLEFAKFKTPKFFSIDLGILKQAQLANVLPSNMIDKFYCYVAS